MGFGIWLIRFADELGTLRLRRKLQDWGSVSLGDSRGGWRGARLGDELHGWASASVRHSCRRLLGVESTE